MGLLNKCHTYLVGPMEYTTDGESWRQYVTKQLEKLGVICFDPYNHPFISSRFEDERARRQLKDWMGQGKYDLVAEHMKQIRSEDLRTVDLSDFLIVYLNPKVPTVGSIEELTTAVREKKVIFMVIEGGKKNTPLWVLGMMPHKFIYDNFDDALNVLNKIDSGEITIDNERWKLLRPEFR